MRKMLLTDLNELKSRHEKSMQITQVQSEDSVGDTNDDSVTLKIALKVAIVQSFYSFLASIIFILVLRLKVTLIVRLEYLSKVIKYQFIARQKTFFIIIFINKLSAFGITEFPFQNFTSSQIS